MAPDKHALLNQLTETSRNAIRHAAAEGRVPIDDLVQALLARDVPRHPAHANALGDAVSSVPEDVIAEVRRDLAEAWPLPEPPRVVVIVRGARVAAGKLDAYIERAVAHVRKAGYSIPLALDFTPRTAVQVCFFYPWDEGAPTAAPPVTPEDAEALLPLLVIDEPPAVEATTPDLALIAPAPES